MTLKKSPQKLIRRIGVGLILFSLAWMLIDGLSNKAHASSMCNGHFPDPFLDVCWDCVFPVTIGDAEVYDSDLPDTDNPSLPVCACPEPPPIFERVGITVGYWEPMALVDVTRTPYCMVNLDGMQLTYSDYYGHGDVNSIASSQDSDLYYVHWYIFPLMYWLNVLSDGLCVEKGSFDIAYMTELDPTWTDDELAFILNPEAALFGDQIAQAACAEDAIQAEFTVPNDYLYWCSGAQGSMYPLTGHVAEHVGGVQASTLLAERMDFKMHREGLIWESTPADSQDVCYEYPSAIMPKSHYRYQMTNPIPTADSHGCHQFGHSTATWGAGHEFPYSGEDFGYLIWRKRNCCAF